MKRLIIIIIAALFSAPAFAQFGGIYYQSIESGANSNNSYNPNTRGEVYTTTGYHVDSNGSIVKTRIKVEVKKDELRVVGYYRQTQFSAEWVNCNGYSTPLYSAKTNPGLGRGTEGQLEKSFMFKLPDPRSLSRKIYFDL